MGSQKLEISVILPVNRCQGVGFYICPRRLLWRGQGPNWNDQQKAQEILNVKSTLASGCKAAIRVHKAPRSSLAELCGYHYPTGKKFITQGAGPTIVIKEHMILGSVCEM